jgi:hypothetical protein
MKMLVRDPAVLRETKSLPQTTKSLRFHHQNTPALAAVAGAVTLP